MRDQRRKLLVFVENLPRAEHLFNPSQQFATTLVHGRPAEQVGGQSLSQPAGAREGDEFAQLEYRKRE